MTPTHREEKRQDRINPDPKLMPPTRHFDYLRNGQYHGPMTQAFTSARKRKQVVIFEAMCQVQ
ncbi:hypothetical protein WAI453_002240 [Rhynchosporium graminicola]